MRGKRDWNFDPARRQIAVLAEQVERGDLPKPNTDEVKPPLADFHRLHEEWRNHFGYLRAGVGQPYDDKKFQSEKRKQEIQDEMDRLKHEIGAKLEALPETA